MIRSIAIAAVVLAGAGVAAPLAQAAHNPPLWPTNAPTALRQVVTQARQNDRAAGCANWQGVRLIEQSKPYGYELIGGDANRLHVIVVTNTTNGSKAASIIKPHITKAAIKAHGCL